MSGETEKRHATRTAQRSAVERRRSMAWLFIVDADRDHGDSEFAHTDDPDCFGLTPGLSSNVVMRVMTRLR